jgi:ribosomal protein S10
MYKIIISSSSQNSIELYIQFLTLVLNKLNVFYSVFAFPMGVKKIALLKSPHVYKKAKEHFELRSYKFVVSFDSCINSQTLKILLINKPKSVTLKLRF